MPDNPDAITGRPFRSEAAGGAPGGGPSAHATGAEQREQEQDVQTPPLGHNCSVLSSRVASARRIGSAMPLLTVGDVLAECEATWMWWPGRKRVFTILLQLVGMEFGMICIRPWPRPASALG